MSHTRVKSVYHVEGPYGSTLKVEIYCHHNHGNDTVSFYHKNGDLIPMTFESWDKGNDLWDVMNKLWSPFEDVWGGKLKYGVEYYYKDPWEDK